MGIIVYTFRDSAKPILQQMKKTTPMVLAGICMMTVLYHLVEGGITAILVKRYRPDFTWRMGVTNAFFCSFYRVATLGSGAGVAAIVYLGDHGLEYSKGFGLYMMQYAFHKISIAVYSAVLFAVSWTYMWNHFESYTVLLAVGYIVTAIITVILILFCCSRKFHKLLFSILDFFNKKLKGRLVSLTEQLWEQCGIMEVASRHLLKNKAVVAGIVALNLFKFCFWYGIPFLVFKNHADVSLPEVMAVTSLAVMVAAVIPAPAGIGSTEFVLILLFSGIVGTGLAGSASLLYRFGTFVFPFLIGACVVVGRRIRLKRLSFVDKES